MKCACETRWQINVGDKRGWFIVPAQIAAQALVQVKADVQLISVSMSMLRPIAVPGVIYRGDDEYVAKVCRVCGYPTRMEKV